MTDDLILVVGRVETGRPGPAPTALAARDGRVVWLGSAAEARRRTGPRIELPGAVALPGLVDGHTHPAWLGEAAEQVDLSGLGPGATRAAVAEHTGSRWIRGFGWDEARWPEPPHRRQLDGLSDRPIVLHRVDRHVAWVDSRALAAAGIDRATADPPGGRIGRDPDGTPNGLLYDDAIRRVLAAEPPPTADDRRRWLSRAAARFAAAGLTAVHDVCASAADVAAWRALRAAGRLPVRVHLLVDGEDPALDAALAAGPRRDPWLSVAGVKLFADGALGSRGAWLSAPYSDAPHTCGRPVVRGEALRRRAARYAEAGFQVAVHAIGDRAAREAVAALEAARPMRHRVEHAQVVDPQTVAALGRAGLVAGIQPTHAVADAPWIAERLGPERLRWAFPWRSLAAAGAALVIGSDCPIAPADPLAALRAAMAPPIGEGLSFEAALAASTRGAARAAFAEADRGVLAPGFAADITVVDGEPRRPDGPPPTIRATFVGGRATFGPR